MMQFTSRLLVTAMLLSLGLYTTRVLDFTHSANRQDLKPPSTEFGLNKIGSPRFLAPGVSSALDSSANAISAGANHNCAITTSGGVKCWGNNYYGSLGDGTTTDRLTPVDVIGLSYGVIAIAAGGNHTCALTTGGGVKCWGDNYQGQLGDGTNADHSTPVDVLGLSRGVIAIAAGTAHTCALMSGGGLRCWGYNDWGQLGDGTTTARNTPVDVIGLLQGVLTVTTTNDYTCALTTEGGVMCWGLNSYGQLGDGTTNDRSTPVNVVGLSSGVIAVSTGAWHTCAITNSATKCWGRNDYGQLGDGTTTDRLTPADVIGLSIETIMVDMGELHTCAVTTTGGIKCWGDNRVGQLGDGTTMNHETPEFVIGLYSGVTEISGGSFHTCVRIGLQIMCWGDNQNGQLGNGQTMERTTPEDVIGLSIGIMGVATGGSHTCALTNGGGVKCWGDNRYGQLGDGTTTNRRTPEYAFGLSSGVEAVATGGSHTCALTNGGGVKCWGDNQYGQLGDGTTTNNLTPVDVIGLFSGVVAIVAGNDHNCALTSEGGVKCWGKNYEGQLGDGTNVGHTSPVSVVGLSSGVASVTAGGHQTCVRTISYGIKCWGSNRYGQLGYITFWVPVNVVGFGPFLDLPVKYTIFEDAAQANTGQRNSEARINAWFDHTNPGWGNADGNLTRWDGTFGTPPIGINNCQHPPANFSNCYDAHNGLDLRAKDNNYNVLAAGDGNVVIVVNDWPAHNCEGFGNCVKIDHLNCYMTLYGHLQSVDSMVKDATPQNPIYVASHQLIGVMGDTGPFGDGVHLHFGVYLDPNCDGNWSDKVPVDPYGWSGSANDPYLHTLSYSLWTHSLEGQNRYGSTGGSVSSPSGLYQAVIPSGAVTDPVTVNLLVSPPVSHPSTGLLSIGRTFNLWVLEWLPTGTTNISYLDSIDQFNIPITVTINYTDTLLTHLDENNLSIYQWDETIDTWQELTTSNDIEKNISVANTLDTGHFDLQAPLLCPNDLHEPSDDYYASIPITPSQTIQGLVFDILEDEDWFKFETVTNTTYIIESQNLTPGVDTYIELYGKDGVTLITSDDNSGGGVASYLEWIALSEGTYYVRVRRDTDSYYGCNARYDINFTAIQPEIPNHLYLPFVISGG